MASQHAMLHERFKHLSMFLDVSVLILSAFLTFIGFANNDLKVAFIERLPGSPNPSYLIGLSALSVFLISIVDWRLNWKTRSQAHLDAVKSLSNLKHEFSIILSSEKPVSDMKFNSVIKQYQAVSKILPIIPERDFAKTKKKHRVKGLVSNSLDRFPGASLICVKWKIFWRHNIKHWKE